MLPLPIYNASRYCPHISIAWDYISVILLEKLSITKRCGAGEVMTFSTVFWFCSNTGVRPCDSDVVSGSLMTVTEIHPGFAAKLGILTVWVFVDQRLTYT